MDKTEIIKGLKIATNKIGGCSDVGGWLSDDESEARCACEQVIKGLEDGTIILREEDKCISVVKVDLGKMADRVAEKALDEFTYKDKTLKEWIKIIVAQDLLAIEELESLRAELHETAEMHIDGDYYLRDEWIDEYIDNHIKELKGE